MNDYSNISCLLRQMTAGDNDAWFHFLKKYGGLIRSQIKKVVIRKEDGEDCFQNIFISLLDNNCRALKKLDLRCSDEGEREKVFRSWICVVSFRHALKWKRKKSSIPFPPEIADVIPSSAIPPDQETFRRQIGDLIHQKLGCKECLVTLFIMEGLTLSEIAELLDISKSTVSNYREKAFSEIRKFLPGLKKESNSGHYDSKACNAEDAWLNFDTAETENDTFPDMRCHLFSTD